MATFNTIPKFKFWCQKVLPLVYDESLSYEELLCKVVKYLNNVIEDVNTIPEYINELISDDKLKEIMSELLNELREQIAEANEETKTYATKDRYEGELVWLNGKLVMITRPILAGTIYIEDTDTEGITGNYKYTTIEKITQRVYYPNQELLCLNSVINGEYEVVGGDRHVYNAQTSTIEIIHGD